MASSDFALFMGQLLRKPHQVVALAPSSRGLCAEMARELDPAKGPVVELGAGTGNITQAIMDAGVAPEHCHSIEMNPEFCDRLRARFPGLNVYQMSAGDCGDLPLTGVQAVVSGLPLLSMPLPLQRAILGGFTKLVAPGGDYVQFTYGPKPPVAKAVREELSLTWRKSDKIWWNMPPARVYRFTQG
ncbi:class I SAM-dependent methyltransferase [Jannaschia sp. CCS1]|uniref:class I SAM-dependent methyltransferase n=1 Tax=Jannaschia sp. (strain CCS1) TaxID=290400 RepID=UPI000053CD73|nr:methyltransferase domain-containing protein [Jannaschia sp. CCS1]ABD55309.1 Methyltransferase type 12 [Jannaschia sp. CCS1]